MRMKIVVIGEKTWPAEEDVVILGFDELDNRGLRLLPSGILEIHAPDGKWDCVQAIVWRGQFDSHFSTQHCLLSLIRASGVKCLNPAGALFNYTDRISMHRALADAGMPLVPSAFFFGANGYGYFYEPVFPCVLKVGNWHMGYGKMKVQSKPSWMDAVDMASICKDFIAVEPFVEYQRDLRVLVIGYEIYAIERKGSQWKANVCPIEMNETEIPDQLAQLSRKAASALGVEIIGLDWLQTAGGEWLLLEGNLAPGLNWEGTDLRHLVIQELRKGGWG
jgi:ribosomal protein S6--L-glutamate ligase